MEGELPNGLIVGHAYSVTGAKYVRPSFHEIHIGKRVMLKIDKL